MKEFIRNFKDAKCYTQECGPNCEFSTILEKNEIGDMQAGFIKMKGPTWNQAARHDKWHQFYIMLKGEGIMTVGDKKMPVKAPAVIKIPFNTVHAMEVEAGNYVEYIYVNQHIN